MSRLDDKLADWKRKLLDLTRRNPALYFKPGRSANLEIQHPNSDALIQALVIDDRAFSLYLPEEKSASDAPAEDSDYPTSAIFSETRASRENEIGFNGSEPTVLRRRVKSIYRAARADFDERAITTLYVALGMLEWNEGGNETIRSPLLLVPVFLERDSENATYELRVGDEEPVVNPSLAAKLEADFHLSLPPAPDDWEATGISEWLSVVQSAVHAYRWTVRDSAWLGRFSFHKLSLYQDLDANADLIKSHDIVKALGGDSSGFEGSSNGMPAESDLDTSVNLEDTYHVLDADSSQLACIEVVNRGHNLVIQGPPGTGKSQTIVNLIAQTIATGRTVLFVSEKIAALEVVYKRLRENGLGALCLELHSHKANKREVVAELHTAMRHPPAARDSFSQEEFGTLASRRDELNAYAAAINSAQGTYPVPIFRLLGELAALNSCPYVDSSADFVTQPLTRQRLATALDLSRELARVWRVATSGDAHPWFGYSGPAYSLSTRTSKERGLRTLLQSAEDLLREADRVGVLLGLPHEDDVDMLSALHDVATVVDETPGVEPEWLLYNADDVTTKIAAWMAALQLSAELSGRLLSFVDITNQAIMSLSKESWESQRDHFVAQFKNTESAATALASLQTLTVWTRSVLDAILGITASLAELRERHHLDCDRSRVAVIGILSVLDAKAEGICPEPSWFDRGKLHAIEAGLLPLSQALQRHELAKAKLLERYDASILTLDLDILIQRFSNEYRSLLRYFRPDYKRDVALLRTARRDARVPKDVLSDLHEARDCLRLHQAIYDEHSRCIGDLGTQFRGASTNFHDIRKAVAMVKSLRELVVEPSADLISFATDVSKVDASRRAAQSLRLQLERFDEISRERNPLSRDGQLFTLSDRVDDCDLLRLAEHASTTLNALRDFECYMRPMVLASRQNVTLEHVDTIVKLLEEYRRSRVVCEQHLVEIDGMFGHRFVDSDEQPDWRRLSEVAAWLGRSAILPADLSPQIRERMRNPGRHDRVSSVLASTIDRYKTTLSAVDHWFDRRDGEAGQTLATFRSGEIRSVSQRATQLVASLDYMQEWCDFEHLKVRFTEAGFSALFRGVCGLAAGGSLPLDDVAKKSLLQVYVDAQLQANPILLSFRGESQHRKVSEFVALDRQLVSAGASRVQRQTVARRTQQLVAYPGSEVSVLLTEANKRKKHLPIRRLFARMPRLLQELKPCLLMSPLSVSQYLDPATTSFDLVIFDEASQISSEDAISAIFRGKRLVVCGDKQQLPPTNFFVAGDSEEGDNEGEEAEIATFDSILAELESAGLPERSLRWHYRSADESLIAFSNERFYRHTLVTFPSAVSDRGTTAVELIYVPDGVYDRGGRRDNPVEADRVVDFIVEHCANHPELSLGVVAFSRQQADAIEDRLEVVRKQRPDLEEYFADERLNGFFVKNLERVQGDERDVIVFSVGYGRGRDGRLSMNFGPINGEGGEKRLNVAVTRARQKVVVVSSIRAGDMDLSGTSRPGVLALHKYLDYAERGYAALDQNIIDADYDSPFEADVAAEIRALGYTAVPQVGVSSFRIDLGVSDPAAPGRFILGVECDGAMYHSAYTARDRDRLRHEILTNKMHWRLHRIWSPDWLRQRTIEITRLRRAIEDARSMPTPTTVRPSDLALWNAQSEPAPTGVVASDQADREPIVAGDNWLTTDRPWISDYEVATIQSRPVNADFHDPQSASCLAEMVFEVVMVESPVHRQIVANRVARRWGLQRVGARMFTAMNHVYARLERARRISIVDDFLHPYAGIEVDRLRRPVSGDARTLRPIEHVSELEIGFGLRKLLQEAMSLERDQAIVEVARALGFDRTGRTIRERVDGVVEQLLSAGIIVNEGGRLLVRPEDLTSGGRRSP